MEIIAQPDWNSSIKWYEDHYEYIKDSILFPRNV